MENKTEKPIAVTVYNKYQFNALMKLYESYNWYNWAGVEASKTTINGYPTHVTYENNFCSKDAPVNYEIISFNAFSKLTGVVAEETEIVISLPFIKVIVTRDGFSVEDENGEDSNITKLSAKNLEAIYAAYQSL
jgi:uncharacterized lipoprotein YehR (DUF1307 family)